jgi:hypothetical protein
MIQYGVVSSLEFLPVHVAIVAIVAIVENEVS